MSHANNFILNKFKKITHIKDEVIKDWFTNGINSIRVELKNHTDIIFTYHTPTKWKIESVDISKQVKLYIKEKLKVLKELKIDLTEAEKQHLKSLTNEVDIDNFAHDLIMGIRHIK